jgi:RND family efflux transporter MFP subunit
MSQALSSSRVAGMAVSCLLAASAWGCEGVGNADSRRPGAEETRTGVEVMRVETETLAEERKITGDVTAWEMVPLSFTVGGRLAAVYFEEGDSVARGDLVAVLDSKDYRLIRDLARAQVKALDPHLERAERLKGDEAVTQAQLDELVGRMEVALIQKSQAESQLSYARLRAPVDGVIIKRLASAGDMTDASHPVGILARMKRMKAVLPVSQRDLALFEHGKEVEITALGLGRTFVGKVFSVGYAADTATRTFPVALEVPNEDLALRAGMVIEARVKSKTMTGIFLPLDVIRRDLDGAAVVLTADRAAGRAEARKIVLGEVVGERVQVLEGLGAGDEVIVRGMVDGGDPIAVLPLAGGDAGERE